METQRVYELDRKELKSELQTKEVELKYNVRHSFLSTRIVIITKSLFNGPNRMANNVWAISYGPY